MTNLIKILSSHVKATTINAAETPSTNHIISTHFYTVKGMLQNGFIFTVHSTQPRATDAKLITTKRDTSNAFTHIYPTPNVT
jgi:hypothetical protein